MILAVALCSAASMHLKAQIQASQTSGCAPLIGVQFTHSFAGATGVNWDFGNGASSTSNSPTHTYQTPGTYTVTFTAAGGIQETIEINVLDRPQAGISILSDAGGCIPLQVQFADDSQPADGATIVSWSWDFGDGGVATGEVPNPTHTYTLIGINDVVLVVQDNNGCSGSVTLPAAVVTSVPPELTLNSNPDNTSACNPPFTVDFSAAATSSSPQSNALTYEWTFADGSTSAQANPAAITYTENGEYPISVTVTDDVGCSSTSATAVFVGSPQAALELLDGPNFCDTVYVVNHSDPATTMINWGTGGNQGVSLTVDTLMNVYEQSGDYEVTITVSSPGCESSATVELSIDNTDVSIASSPNFTCLQELTVTYEAFSDNAAEIFWTFLNDTNEYSGSTIDYTHVSPASNDPYFQGGPDIYGATVNIITDGGCLGTASAFNDTIWVPHASFGVDTTKGCMPLTVMFSDSSSAPSPITGWEWVFGDGNTVWLDDMDEAYEHTYVDHGDFEPYLVIHTAEGCTDTSFTVLIGVGADGEPELDLSSTSVCPGEEFTINISMPGGYEPEMWTVQTDNLQFSTCPDNPDINGSMSSEAGWHDMTVFVVYNGCESTATFENAIEVKGPVGHLSAQMNCDDPYTVLFSVDASGADSWTIDFGDGNSSSNALEVHHSFTESEDYTVVLTTSGSTGCPDYVDEVEISTRNIVAVLEGAEEPFCEGEEILLTGLASEDVEEDCYEGYLWLIDPAIGIAPHRNEVGFLSLGTLPGGQYDIALVVEDYNGCTDTSFVELNVSSIASAFDVEYDSPCLPLEVDLIDQSTADVPITSWSWTFSGGGSSTNQNTSYTFQGSATSIFTMSLTVTDSLGCTNTSSQSISPDIPSALFASNTQQVCTGELVNFNAVNSSYPTYNWDLGNGELADGASASTSFDLPGTYTISLEVENAAGCSDSFTANNYIAVQAVPDVGFSTSADDLQYLCYPILIEFTDTTNANIFAYRNWDLGTGFPVVSTPTVGTIYESPGIYTVSLEVGTTFGCVNTVEKDFVIEGPTADFAMSTDAVCLYDSVQLAIIDSSDVAYFMWDFGNGQDSAMVDPVTYVYDVIPNSGSTHIQLILWSSDSVCSATTQYPFTLNRTIADFDRNLELSREDSIHCFGIQDHFTNYSTDAGSYLWDFGNGASSVAESPSYTYPLGGDWLVTLYASNPLTGCSDTLSKPMKIFPEMVTGAEDGLACLGDTIFLSAFGGESYEWTPSAVVANPTSPDTYVFDTQSHELQVLITDTNDCSQLLDVKADYIFEPPRPTWSDTTVLYGESLFINYPPIPYHQFTWYGMNGGACPGCGTPNFTPTFNMSVGLIVTDELGCYESQFEFNITVDTDLFVYVPNAFSPNGDGVNDLFYPVITQAIPDDYHFSIWNRMGELVWESRDMNEKWRGESRGSEHYSDVTMYVYKLKVRDLKSVAHEFIGSFMLLR